MFGFSLIRTKKLTAVYEWLAKLTIDKVRNRQTMKFNVTIQTALPIQSGTSKNGKAWQKQTFVGVYDSSNAQYPKSIVFDVLGDNINKFNLQQGGQYEVEVDFTAREWQGKYFLSANCWKATRLDTPQQATPVSASAIPTLDSMGVQGYQQGQYAQQTQTAYPPADDDTDSLPF